MGTRKIIGIIVLIVGLILFILSLAGDVIKLGVSPTFGPMQVGGTIIGLLVVVVGLILIRKKK